MKRKIMTAVLSVIAAGAAVAYCRTTGGEMPAKGAQQAPGRTAGSAAGAGGRVLVAYFFVPETDGTDASSGASRVLSDGGTVGSTRYVAEIIREATGGDLFEIRTVRTYPGSHEALIDAAKREHDDGARPELASHVGNLKEYDAVFVGFPNWWYDMPMPLYTFFDEYDFGGKTVIPFCTHGGSRFSGAVETIRGLEPRAAVLDGYAVARDRVPGSREGVLKWLERIGMKR